MVLHCLLLCLVCDSSFMSTPGTFKNLFFLQFENDEVVETMRLGLEDWIEDYFLELQKYPS